MADETDSYFKDQGWREAREQYQRSLAKYLKDGLVEETMRIFPEWPPAGAFLQPPHGPDCPCAGCASATWIRNEDQVVGAIIHASTDTIACWQYKDSSGKVIVECSEENLRSLIRDGFFVSTTAASDVVSASLIVKRDEIGQCADRREMRRLVAAKLQPLGDALLAAMEKVRVPTDG